MPPARYWEAVFSGVPCTSATMIFPSANYAALLRFSVSVNLHGWIICESVKPRDILLYGLIC